MTPESKRLKVGCLIAMTIGLVAIIVGIGLLLTGSRGVPLVLATIFGVLCLFAAARGSMLANVPANAGRVFVLSLVIALACILMGVAMAVLFAAEMVANVLFAAMTLIMLVVAGLARVIVNKLSRV